MCFRSVSLAPRWAGLFTARSLRCVSWRSLLAVLHALRWSDMHFLAAAGNLGSHLILLIRSVDHIAFSWSKLRDKYSGCCLNLFPRFLPFWLANGWVRFQAAARSFIPLRMFLSFRCGLLTASIVIGWWSWIRFQAAAQIYPRCACSCLLDIFCWIYKKSYTIILKHLEIATRVVACCISK